jgi:hypothetical protein
MCGFFVSYIAAECRLYKVGKAEIMKRQNRGNPVTQSKAPKAKATVGRPPNISSSIERKRGMKYHGKKIKAFIIPVISYCFNSFTRNHSRSCNTKFD